MTSSTNFDTINNLYPDTDPTFTSPNSFLRAQLINDSLTIQDRIRLVNYDFQKFCDGVCDYCIVDFNPVNTNPNSTNYIAKNNLGNLLTKYICELSVAAPPLSPNVNYPNWPAGESKYCVN
jgi:hypothetical protein